jgi:hypothetical protein
MMPGWWELDTGNNPILLAEQYQSQNVSRQHPFDPMCSSK